MIRFFKHKKDEGSEVDDSQQSQNDGIYSDLQVREFLELLTERDKAKGDARKEVEMKAAEFAAQLTARQRREIVQLLEGVEYMGVVDAQRRTARNRIRYLIPNAIGFVSDPIARTTGNTIEFALNLLGQTVGGTVRGIRKAADAFGQAA